MGPSRPGSGRARARWPPRVDVERGQPPVVDDETAARTTHRTSARDAAETGAESARTPGRAPARRVEHHQVGAVAHLEGADARGTGGRAPAAVASASIGRGDGGTPGRASACRRRGAWRATGRGRCRSRSSVPNATVTPASSISGTGAIPLASFRLDAGLWATLAPAGRRARCRAGEVDAVAEHGGSGEEPGVAEDLHRRAPVMQVATASSAEVSQAWTFTRAPVRPPGRRWRGAGPR